MIVVCVLESRPRRADQILRSAGPIAFRLLSLAQPSGPDCSETLADPAPPPLWIST